MKNNKKVGIVTFHWAKNFGAVLQAYSLKHTVEMLGFDAYILDYVTKEDRIANYNYFTFGSKSAYLSDILKIIFYKKFKTSYKKFSDFRKEFLGISNASTKISTVNDITLKTINDTYAFITGSDQVWHPRGFDDVYGLAFASSKGIKTIAYAPSLRMVGMTDSIKIKMQTDISKIDFLSGREPSVANFVTQLTGRECKVVVDPVFLTSKKEWESIAILPKFDFQYVLVYTLTRNAKLERVASDIAKKLGTAVVVLTGSNPKARGFIRAKRVMFEAGPLDFIGLIANARFVCTNSFHGTAFACILRRPFYAFQNGITDTRVSSLLEQLGMEQRFVPAQNKIISNETCCHFENIERKLPKLVTESLEYLRFSLQSAEKKYK